MSSATSSVRRVPSLQTSGKKTIEPKGQRSKSEKQRRERRRAGAGDGCGKGYRKGDKKRNDDSPKQRLDNLLQQLVDVVVGFGLCNAKTGGDSQKTKTRRDEKEKGGRKTHRYLDVGETLLPGELDVLGLHVSALQTIETEGTRVRGRHAKGRGDVDLDSIQRRGRTDLDIVYLGSDNDDGQRF